MPLDADLPRNIFNFTKPQSQIVKPAIDSARIYRYNDTIKEFAKGTKYIFVLKNVKNTQDYIEYAKHNEVYLTEVDGNDPGFANGITILEPRNGSLVIKEVIPAYYNQMPAMPKMNIQYEQYGACQGGK